MEKWLLKLFFFQKPLAYFWLLKDLKTLVTDVTIKNRKKIKSAKIRG